MLCLHVQCCISLACAYIEYSSARTGQYWSRFVPSVVQTLNSVVALLMGSESGAVREKVEWRGILSNALKIVDDGLMQRIAGDAINVQFFEGNTAICTHCHRCFIMPYDYFGILHYLAHPTDGNIKTPYRLGAADGYCEYLVNSQRSNGSWPSIDSPTMPDDPLATACNALILSHHNNVKYMHNIRHAQQALKASQTTCGRWVRPDVQSANIGLHCATEVELLTTHKCIEALLLSSVTDNKDSIDCALVNLLHRTSYRQPAVGFLRKHGVYEYSDVAGLCHCLQALLKAGVSTNSNIIQELVRLLINFQFRGGGFKYTFAEESPYVPDTSDITAFSIQTLALFLLKHKNEFCKTQGDAE